MNKTAKNFALITEKLGFPPWGGCSECPNLAYCSAHERGLATLPCELEDSEAGVNPHRPNRKSVWDTLTEAA